MEGLGIWIILKLDYRESLVFGLRRWMERIFFCFRIF